MPIAYTELFEGRSTALTKDGWTDTQAFMYESGDAVAVLAEQPPYGTPSPRIGGLVIVSVTAEPVEALNRCRVTRTYGPPDNSTPPKPNTYNETWSWQMVAQSKTVTTAPDVGYQILEWNRIDNRWGVPPPNQFIGYDGKEYKGASLYQPTGMCNVSKLYPNGSQINSSFRKMLYSAQSKTNLTPWLDWAKYEVLFLGASVKYGAPQGNSTVPTATIDFSFIFGVTALTVEFEVHRADYTEQMDIATIASVAPHEYIWQEPFIKSTKPQGEGSDQKGVFPGPKNVKIAQMYGQFEFSRFGLVGPGV